MMKYEIRELQKKEIDALIDSIWDAPDITYINRYVLRLLKEFVVVTDDNKLVGVCGFTRIGFNWGKLGPLIVLNRYRGMGIGKKLFDVALNELPSKYVYVGTSNMYLKKMIREYGFEEIPTRNLPWQVKRMFVVYTLMNLTPMFIKEVIRKLRVFPVRDYMHFVIKE